MTRQLQLFEKRLPERFYCSDDLELGLLIRFKQEAIAKRYIQHNPRNSVNWMVFDIDRPGGGYDWEFREAPAPNIVAENRKNLHAHLFYGLGIPVHKNLSSRSKPLRYAASIEHALVKKLGGDYGYAGLISKNPLCRYWNVRTYEDYLYDLDWLSDYVDLEPYRDQRRHLPDYGLGRNCTLFERLRKWSYRAVLKVEWPSYEAWHAEVLSKAADYNDFTVPLPFTEIKSTAKSIARWTWKRMSIEGFSIIQQRRNLLSQAVRKAKADKKRQLIFQFDGEPSIKVSRITGIPSRTIRRLRISTSPFTISDKEWPFTISDRCSLKVGLKRDRGIRSLDFWEEA
ncbi:hypothetical protein ES702_03947 [subsurface metagenome]